MLYPLDPTPGRTRRRAGWIAAALLLLVAGCRSEAPVITARFMAFDSIVDLSLVRVEPALAARAQDLIEQDFRFLDNTLDTWKTGVMERVNQLLPTGEPFVAPPAILPLVRMSQTYEKLSGGLFNPALGNLIALWGFNVPQPECNPPPRDQVIERWVKANPRMADIALDGLEIQGNNRALRLDFQPIIRGYAIDLAIAQIKELGIRDALVQIGPDLRAIGDRGGQPWRIPIRRPSGAGVLAVLKVMGDESVATTAAYDRDFIYGGVNYHHILDPRTGQPARGTQSVTVVHGDAATATAAATALFIAGPKRWHEVAQAFGLRYVILVDSTGTVHLNPELHARLDIVDSNAELILSPPLAAPPGAPPTAAGQPRSNPA